MTKYAISFLAIALTCVFTGVPAFASDDSSLSEFDAMLGAVKSAKMNTKTDKSGKQTTAPLGHAFHASEMFENLAGSRPQMTMDQINHEITAHPQSPTAYIQRGNSYILDGDEQPALRDFDQARRLRQSQLKRISEGHV